MLLKQTDLLLLTALRALTEQLFQDLVVGLQSRTAMWYQPHHRPPGKHRQLTFIIDPYTLELLAVLIGDLGGEVQFDGGLKVMQIGWEL
jgi:hypothetical protein